MRLTRVLTTIALTAGLALTVAPAAMAHSGDDQDRQVGKAMAKREQLFSGADVPLLSSPNVHLESTFPDVAAISGCWAKTAPYFYVSSLKSISVFDARDPKNPKLTGVLPNLVFENEAMNCGEKVEDGKRARFVLVGVDLTQASTDDIEHVRPVGFDEFLVVDVTDPAKPYIRSRVKTTSSTHTVTCVYSSKCEYVYTAGDGGDGAHFSIVDMRDLDKPRQIRKVPSPALAFNPQFGGGAGHKWNFDSGGYGMHTGSGGTAMFDVRTPTRPKLVTSTGAKGIAPGWNDFIHHNAARHNGVGFKPDAAPSTRNGNVLMVTEEDYMNTDCATAGSFQTWHVKRLNGTRSGGPPASQGVAGGGAITPLDRINPVQPGEGVAAPHLGFCSAHWFDYHPSGIVAQGFYQGGLRLLDVRNPRDIKEYGYFASGLSEVWDAYWVPKRDSSGTEIGRTNIVYTVDLVRGLDVFSVDLPGRKPTQPPLPPPFGLDGILGLGFVVVFSGLLRKRRR